MAKKKTAPKRPVKATGAKVDAQDVKTKKVPKKADAKPQDGESVKPRNPGWLKNYPTEYIVGTDGYRKVIEIHNEVFGTAYNTWRVKPQVFYVIHEAVKKHWAEKNG